MRHFGHIPALVRDELFHRQPTPFDAGTPAKLLSIALGATLYSPATRPRLAEDVRKQARQGATSMVICLEDSVEDDAVAAAEENLVSQLTDLAARPDDVPLLFIRVRDASQIADLTRRLKGAVRILSGFVLPKFTQEHGAPFLDALTAAETACGRHLYAMPVLESPELVYAETRASALRDIARTIAPHRGRVLALRLGVTDFCSTYGLRRTPEMTAYDLQVVASIIADVVNLFGRADGSGYTITGPVWEYFGRQERLLKPQLRESPFADIRADKLRTTIIEHDLDGLLREIMLDRANGLLGKTCIHPCHVVPVNVLSVVSHEEYADAQDILRPDVSGGVLRSRYTNKMNEVKPHRAWAERVLQRAEVFGVTRKGVSHVELLAACQVTSEFRG